MCTACSSSRGTRTPGASCPSRGGRPIPRACPRAARSRRDATRPSRRARSATCRWRTAATAGASAASSPRTEMPAPLIQVQNLVKHFPVRQGLLARGPAAAVRAVDGITFDIGRGETVGLVGESGCGKTTTGRMIMKLLVPTSGEILFEGEPIGALSVEQEKVYRRQVQMVFQD